MMLADMEAEVIKVEPVNGVGDESRSWGPPFLKGESAYFLSVNRNKRSIVINLTKDNGKKILLRLAQNTDVFLENFRPGTTLKLGIDYESLKRINDHIIYCSVSGFGQSGPEKDKPGYDIIALASSGMMSITGEPGRPPVKMGVPASDIAAGMYSAYSIVCALLRRKNTDQGEYIDVGLQDGMISWLTNQAGSFFATGKNPSPSGSAHTTIAPYQAFKGKDESYFVVAVGNDKLWDDFCKAIGADELRSDKRFETNSERVENKVELEHVLQEIFSTDHTSSWVSKISRAGVPCSLIKKLDQVFSDPHVISRGMLNEVEHPKLGPIKQIGIPYHFSNFRFQIRSPPPTLGEHTSEILSSLGFSKAEINKLRAKGVVK
jgi:formyl-CoA transferase/CoA:oxalate CoA-transferase